MLGHRAFRVTARQIADVHETSFTVHAVQIEKSGETRNSFLQAPIGNGRIEEKP